MTLSPTLAPAGLDPLLDAVALRALQSLSPVQDWVVPRPDTTHDVVLVGGGQNGVALAFLLKRLGVRRVFTIDSAPEGEQGVWRFPARMNVLRTAKHLIGPELGVAELSFRHWFEARHGADAYDALTYIRRLDWAAYLDWFRVITQTTVQHNTSLVSLDVQGEGLRLRLRTEGTPHDVVARKVIFTSGVTSFGGPLIPDVVAGLPTDRYAHTAHHIDFEQIRGRDVAILGAAASAFDATATALEHGARSVRLFSRRREPAHHAATRLRGDAAATANFHLLPDAARWQLIGKARSYGSNPPREALVRLSSFKNFFVHRGATWDSVSLEQDRLRIDASDGVWRADFVVLGTGYHNDLARVQALAPIARHIANWGDVYQPPTPWRDAVLARAPYLGPNFELTGKDATAPAQLKDVHIYGAAAATSFGRPVGDVPCMAGYLPQLAQAVVRDLYFADLDLYLERALGEPPEDFALSLFDAWRPDLSVATDRA